MARISVSNSSGDDFINNTQTLTIAGLTDAELLQVAAKLDELGWTLHRPDRNLNVEADIPRGR